MEIPNLFFIFAEEIKRNNFMVDNRAIIAKLYTQHLVKNLPLWVSKEVNLKEIVQYAIYNRENYESFTLLKDNFPFLPSHILGLVIRQTKCFFNTCYREWIKEMSLKKGLLYQTIKTEYIRIRGRDIDAYNQWYIDENGNPTPAEYFLSIFSWVCTKQERWFWKKINCMFQELYPINEIEKFILMYNEENE